MSKGNKNFLHLPLDEIRNGIAANVGNLGSYARVMGSPQIIHDPELGSCLSFDGVDDYLELTGLENLDLTEGFSLAAWVRFDHTHSWYAPILDINDQKGPEGNLMCVFAHQDEEKLNLFSQGELIRVPNRLKMGTWLHIAITVSQNGFCKILLDGQINVTGRVPFFWKKNAGQNLFSIGNSTMDEAFFFKGAIADFRLYDHALEERHIVNLMKKDKVNIGAFRETIPVKMELYSIKDDFHLPVIFIESDNKSEPLELSITNPTEQPIVLKRIATPTINDFHFQLRFRKNVVAPNVLDALRSNPVKILGNWHYSLIGPGDGGKEDWISFAHAAGEDFSVEKGESIAILFPQFSAAAQGGARNTRVEVRYQLSDLPSGSVIRHLEIQSHLGLKTVPLIAQVKGSNSVLNDGKTANELTIEVLFSKHDGSVVLSSDRNRPSRFELVVDEELMVSNSLSADTATDGFNTQPTAEGVGHKTFTFEVQKAASLSKNEKLIINLHNWITDAPTGVHNLLLRYENIPGYWDGAWVLPVELGPIVIRENNVGIGTDNPQTKLHVKSNGGLVAEFESEYEYSAIRLVSKEGTDNRVGIANRPGGKLALFTENMHSNQFVNDDLTITKDGKVGIGTDNPEEKLHVKGRIKDLTGLVMPVGSIIAYGGNTAPEGWLLCDGKQISIEDNPSLGSTDRGEELRKILRGKSENSDHGWNTPNLRERFVVGANPEIDKYQLNKKGGEETHKLTIGEMPAHSHSFTAYDSNFQHHAESSESQLKNEGKGSFSVSTNSAGDSHPHNNLPPYYALTYIIKY
jgi:microcystin-dependent protein